MRTSTPTAVTQSVSCLNGVSSSSNVGAEEGHGWVPDGVLSFGCARPSLEAPLDQRPAQRPDLPCCHTHLGEVGPPVPFVTRGRAMTKAELEYPRSLMAETHSVRAALGSSNIHDAINWGHLGYTADNFQPSSL
jgi:hypothetical protein